MGTNKILVIEDNELNMKLVRGLLSLGNYIMIEAPDAENGIQMAHEHHPDLVLMDIQLPGMDGLEATKIISNDADLKGIPIIALTSFAMEGDEKKAQLAGCAGYITKPIDTRNFLNNINKFLDNDLRDDGTP
jgi:CheY-like chemotaxis protein